MGSKWWGKLGPAELDAQYFPRLASPRIVSLQPDMGVQSHKKGKFEGFVVQGSACVGLRLETLHFYAQLVRCFSS